MASVIRILILSFLFGYSLNAQDRTFTASFESAKVDQILLDIAAHFKVDLVFSSTYFEDLSPLTINFEGVGLRESVEKALSTTDISFTLDGKQIRLLRKRIIFGYIRDADDNELLAFANVYNSKIQKGSSSNMDGYFSLKLPYETDSIYITYIGYQKKVLNLKGTDGMLEIYLEPLSSLSEVTITPLKVDQISISEDRDRELFMKGLYTRLSTGGEADINQYLYTQTGVSSGPDGIGGLHVRGGNTDQNLFLLDGVQVLQSNHAFGLFSIFNTNLLSNAKFSKDNFDPKYFGGVSSIVDMKLENGSNKKIGGEVSFSTLASQVNINGPLVKGKTSFLLSGRLSHINPIIKNISELRNSDDLTNKFYTYGFYDFNAKVSHQLSKSTSLFLTYYQGNDRLKSKEEFLFQDEELLIQDDTDFSLNYGNRVAAVRLSHNFGERLYSNTLLSYSEYTYKNSSLNEFSVLDGIDNYTEFYEDDLNFRSNVKQYTLRQDLEFYLNPNKKIDFGGQIQIGDFLPGTYDDLFLSEIEDDGEVEREVESSFYTSNRYLSTSGGLYFNTDLNFSRLAFVQLGVNYSFLCSQNLITNFWSSFHLLQGRISLRSEWTEAFTTRISLDRREQAMHLLSSSNIGFPNDVWVPAFGDLEPQESYQLNLMGRLELNKNLTLKTSVFLRYLDNLLRNNAEISLPFLEDRSTELWEDSTLIGDGISRGLEVDLNFANKKLSWSIAYTLSKYDRFFADLNDELPFPFVFDQNHNLSLNLNYKISDRLVFYVQFQFSKGRRQTLYEAFNYSPFQSYNNDYYNQAPEQRVSEINEYQLPDYHRLDLGINMKLGKKENHTLTLGIQNVYNRSNVYFAYYQKVDEFLREEGFEEGFNEILALPILPTLRYEYNF